MKWCSDDLLLHNNHPKLSRKSVAMVYRTQQGQLILVLLGWLKSWVLDLFEGTSLPCRQVSTAVCWDLSWRYQMERTHVASP